MDKCKYAKLGGQNFGERKTKTKCKPNIFCRYGFLFFVGSFFLTGIVLSAYYSDAFFDFSPSDKKDIVNRKNTTEKEIVDETSTTEKEIVDETSTTEKEIVDETSTTEKEIVAPSAPTTLWLENMREKRTVKKKKTYNHTESTSFNKTRPMRYVTKPYVYIQPINERTPIKNLYIDLDSQEKCKQRNDIECWNAYTEYDHNYVVNVQVMVSYIMNNCKATEAHCTLVDDKRCFHQRCSQKAHVFIFFNQIGSSLWARPENVYFLLTEGNYHSSWQSEYLSDINRENMIKTQALIHKINVFKNIPSNQLFLSFTKVVECDKTSCQASGTWLPEQSTVLPVVLENYNVEPVTVNKYFSLSAIVTVKKDLIIGGHLHERLHEFINGNALSFLMQKIYINSTTQIKVYTGKHAVSAVLMDSRLSRDLQDIIYYYNKIPSLLMQKVGMGDHLGDWGIESSGSSYNHVGFKIGKYTELVMKDVGFESTGSLRQNDFFGLTYDNVATYIFQCLTQ